MKLPIKELKNIIKEEIANKVNENSSLDVLKREYGE